MVFQRFFMVFQGTGGLFFMFFLIKLYPKLIFHKNFTNHVANLFYGTEIVSKNRSQGAFRGASEGGLEPEKGYD